MGLQAVAWTVILAGVVALGTFQKRLEIGLELLAESPETARMAATLTHTNRRGLFRLGHDDPPAARDENAIREQIERAKAEHARADRVANLRAEDRQYEWTIRLSLVLGLVGLLFLAWATRRQIRDWHWLTVFAFATFAATTYVFFTVKEPLALYAALPLDGLAVAATTLDLRRRRYDSPGRVFAWAALSTSLLFGLLLLCAAIGV